MCSLSILFEQLSFYLIFGMFCSSLFVVGFVGRVCVCGASMKAMLPLIKQSRPKSTYKWHLSRLTNIGSALAHLSTKSHVNNGISLFGWVLNSFSNYNLWIICHVCLLLFSSLFVWVCTNENKRMRTDWAGWHFFGSNKSKENRENRFSIFLMKLCFICKCQNIHSSLCFMAKQ